MTSIAAGTDPGTGRHALVIPIGMARIVRKTIPVAVMVPGLILIRSVNAILVGAGVIALLKIHVADMVYGSIAVVDSVTVKRDM